MKYIRSGKRHFNPFVVAHTAQEGDWTIVTLITGETFVSTLPYAQVVKICYDGMDPMKYDSPEKPDLGIGPDPRDNSP